MKARRTVFFQGDHLALLHQIDIAQGTLRNSHKFNCCFHFPRRFSTHRSRLHFLFCCRYTEKEDGYEISYRVYPTFRSGILLLIALMMLIYAICSCVNGSVMDIVCSIVLMVVPILVYTLASACCIRDFIQFFERKS